MEARGMLAPVAEAEGATVVSLDKAPGRKPRLVAGAAAALDRLRPDVIHSHALAALWHLGPMARERGIPIIHTAHNDHFQRERGVVKQVKLRVLHWQATKFAERFCGVAEAVTDAAGRWGTVKRSKLATVLNGIDVDVYADKAPREEIRAQYSIPPTARVVGCVARLVDVKRQDLLIRAVAELGPGFEDVHHIAWAMAQIAPPLRR
jgi:glycosyltransferase involved in cell wall biosynthesis